MKLFLVRHGIAVSGTGGDIVTDAERPLTEEGAQETLLVARGLKNAGVKLELLATSPLVRARQTAAIFADVFKLDITICEALAPGGESSDLYRFLKGKKAGAVALFGHEPDMSELVQTLLGAEFNMNFKKAGVCRIDVSDMPPTSPGVLRWFLPPRLSSLMLK